MTRKLILDLDTGIDDTLAIAYALASEQADDVRLIGITGTYGNVTVETGMRNALAVTDLLGHPEVKVYQGLSHSSTTDHFEVLPVSAFIHGDNGIGAKMIRWIMKSKNVESLESLMKQATDHGVRLVACQMSMDIMGIHQEELIDGVELGGVSTFLGSGETSDMSLFV